MNEQEWRDRVLRRLETLATLLWCVLCATVGCFVFLAVLVHRANAAVVEVQVHANKDGYARLHTEGVQVIGCTPADMGRCQWLTGKSQTTRRVKVHQGSNRIRLKAFRFEDVPAEQLDYGWLRSSDPDRVPQQAAWPTYRAPLNYAYITGVVAGHELEPKTWKVSHPTQGEPQ